MVQVTEDAERLEIVSPVGRGTRVFYALLALFPLLAPYELLWRPRWTSWWHPFFLLAALVSAGAVALSLLLLFASVAALGSRMTFDTAGATFTYAAASPVFSRRTRIPLSSVTGVSVRTHEWSDGSPSYTLKVTVLDGLSFESGSSWSREEIDRAKATVEAFLQR